MADAVVPLSGWEKSLMAAERVRDRCRRATAALDAAAVAYAVAGGNAVAEWVGRVDAGAVRNTRDVDILVRRADFPAVKSALEGAGFVHYRLLVVETFVDGPHSKPSEAVHLLFAREKVRDDLEFEMPDVLESERAADFQVASLESLVRMKLLANRRKDQVHLLDMIGVGLVDASWPQRFPSLLAARLQQLLEDPNG